MGGWGSYRAPEAVVVFRWTDENNRLVCHKTILETTACDWSEVDDLCRKLSLLLDCHDRDRFAHLLRYGGQPA